MSTVKLDKKALDLFNLEGFKELTPVQSKTYALAMKRKDIIATSQTGTGKTHAFLFPLANQLDSTSNTMQAIVIAPTRELATQIFQFAKHLQELDKDLRVELIVGGTDREKMKDKLSKQPHLIIGTPGRIKDLFFDGILRCEQASTVILDEADMIWEYGFLEDVDMILSKINHQLHVMVFSATIPDQLQPFIKRFLTHPLTLSVTEESQLNPQVDHILIHKKHREYGEVLLDLLSVIKPSGCLIFANTRVIASQIAQMMRDHGINTLELHGDLTPRQRTQNLNRIQNDELVYLVATDIAARGLDLPQVSHVISLGFPKQLDFYIHRAGRTGRAGKSGLAYVIVDDEDKKSVEKLGSSGVKFKYQVIKDKELQDIRSFYAKRKYIKKADPDVVKILNRKTEKVKPNYRKKRKLAIDKLQQKKRREMIQKSINEQKKERAKAKQKAKLD